MRRAAVCAVALGVLLAIPGVLRSREGNAQEAPKIEQFAWLAGKWTGTADATSLEFVCSKLERKEMMCMFRAMDDQKVSQLEFISLQETARGIEEHIEFKDGEFADQDPRQITYHVESANGDSAVFATADGSVRNTVTRHGDSEFLSHIEIADASGKKTVIDAKWSGAKE